MRDAMQEAYAEGEISEEEYDDYMDALLERQGVDGIVEEEQLLRERNAAAERAQEAQRQQSQQAVPETFQQLLEKSMGIKPTQAKENTAGDGGERYLINTKYANEIDSWSRAGMPKGKLFVLGSTGDVLQGLGAIESDIYLGRQGKNHTCRPRRNYP